MVAVWSACLVLFASQDSSFEPYPDEVLRVLTESGIDVEGTRAAWTGRLSLDGQTVDYRIEARAGRATALDMTSRYSFPARLSARGLQDWTIGTHTGVVAQSYLDGSVYLAQRIPIDDPANRENLVQSVRAGFGPFALFRTSYVQPMRGQQVFDQPTVFPPKPGDGMVVDYISSQDIVYLAKLWGWQYTGPFGGSSPTWLVPIDVHKRLWKVSGLYSASPNEPVLAGFKVTGDFRAASPKLQDEARSWSKHFKSDRVDLAPDSAAGQISMTIELKGGRSLGWIRKTILEFVKRAQKLPATDDSVYG